MYKYVFVKRHGNIVATYHWFFSLPKGSECIPQGSSHEVMREDSLAILFPVHSQDTSTFDSMSVCCHLHFPWILRLGYP